MAQYEQSQSELRNRVLLVRRSLRMSQHALSRATGLSRQTIRSVERNGGYMPNMAVAVALCVALGRRLGDLFWIEPDPRSGDEQPQT